MRPTAKVIAYTKFLGVPDELLPAITSDQRAEMHCCEDDRRTAHHNVRKVGQDAGTDLARLTECAGRTCYDSYSKGRTSADYHAHILEVGHGSVLEHASISFYLCGISRGCSHELVRHRAGTAISQRSTRYVDESESGWAWHPLVTAACFGPERLNGPYVADAEVNAQEVYRRIVRTVESYLTERGTDKLTARKQARGAARGVLGNALETALVWTANLRALRNVIEQRASEFADAEIRLLANALLDAALPICPEFLSDYERAPCPDGIGYGVKTNCRKV